MEITKGTREVVIVLCFNLVPCTSRGNSVWKPRPQNWLVLSSSTTGLQDYFLWNLNVHTLTLFNIFILCQCPSATYDPLVQSTKDFPDDVIGFMRTHHLMWDPIYPLHWKPVLMRVNVPFQIKQLLVDRVETSSGHVDVLFLGTGRAVLGNSASQTLLHYCIFKNTPLLFRGCLPAQQTKKMRTGTLSQFHWWRISIRSKPM